MAAPWRRVAAPRTKHEHVSGRRRQARFPAVPAKALRLRQEEGKLDGLREGKLDGIRATLLRLVARKAVPLSESDRARIAACTDEVLLDRWIDDVLGASAEDVFR